MEFLIDEADGHAYADYSGDRNPLHLDTNYARKSPFGRPIAHGALVATIAINMAMEGRWWSVNKINIQYLKPILYSRTYRIKSSVCGSTVQIEVCSESSVNIKISVNDIDDISMPEKDGISGDEVGTVQADLVAFQSLAKKHKLGQHNHKIYTIAFSSYYVGMIVPGRQALFSSLSLVFASGVSFDDDRIQYSCSYSVARRFELYRIHASTSVGDQLYIEAFRRPGTIQYPAGSISNLVQHLGRPFAGKKAIVSGGSRGLGRILAVTMALLGAEVTVLYANDPTSISDLLLDISGFEVTIDSVRVDLTCQSEVYEFVRKIDRCDYLFNIASPHIESELFKNFRVSDACNFIDASIRMFSFITTGLSKKICADGIVMFASSEFLDTQPKNFSHYIAAKAAIESLLSSFPVELMRDDIHFLAIRFPRILTDQTNGIRDRAAMISPLTLIPAIIEILITPSAFHNPIRLYGNS